MRFRIDLLLLLTVVVCTWSANRIAIQQRERTAQALTLLESTAGLPFIEDRDQAYLFRIVSKPVTKPEWHLWIPDGKAFYLCAATHGLTKPVLEHFDQFKLMPGRHRVVIKHDDSSDDIYRIRIDERDWKIVDERDWTIMDPPLDDSPLDMNTSKIESITKSKPQSFSIEGRIKLGKVPITVFKTIGKATLAADEKYEPDKHALGLQLWVQP